MIKKYSKFLLMILCCFIGLTSVSAREMTEEEFAQQVHEMRPDANFVYVIGEYAFTSIHRFTREDNILSARSIKVEDVNGKTDKDAIYGEMTVYRYIFDMDEDFNQTNFYYEANMVGTSPKLETLNIKYIDYEFIPDYSKAEITAPDDNDYKKLKDKLGIEFKNDENLKQTSTEDNKVILSGEIYYNDKIGENVFPKDELTGYYYAFVVKVDNIKDGTVVKIGGTHQQTYTRSDFDENGEMVVLMPLDPYQEELEKNITVNVDLDGDGKDFIATEYTIDYQDVVFKRVLEIDKILTDNANKMPADKIGAKLENGTLSLEQKDVVEPLATTGKGLVDTLKSILNTDGVDSVKLTYNGKDYVLTNDNIEDKVKEILSDVTGKDYDKAILNDLIGKSIKLTVDLEDDKVTNITPDGKSKVDYTIDFTGKKAKESEFDVSVDKNDDAYLASVMEWLENLKFDMLDADLKLENGKLTGTILENKNVGEGFSSNPEDLTGYYFTYVIKLKENATDKTVVTLPGTGSTKQVGKDSFDTDNSIVVAFSLKRDQDAKDKVFEIVVDLDGDGQDYIPTTYTIDYSEVKFLTAEEMLELASDNVEKTEKISSVTVWDFETIDGSKYSTNSKGKADLKTKTSYYEDTFANGKTTYEYNVEKGNQLYIYESEDNANWTYKISSVDSDDTDLMNTLFPNYKSVERVDSDVSGTIKLAVTRPIQPIYDTDENGDIIVYNPIKDAVSYVYIKDKKIVKISTDILDVFEEDIQNQFNAFVETVTIETFTEDFVIPESIVKDAVLKNS